MLNIKKKKEELSRQDNKFLKYVYISCIDKSKQERKIQKKKKIEHNQPLREHVRR